MNIGDLDISGLYVGSDEVVAVYLGDEQVFPNGITGWSVSPASINVASSGGTKNITIKSLSSWTISSNDNWITLSAESGDSGVSTVVATIASASTSRSGSIIATDGTSSTTITVSQTTCNPVIISAQTSTIYVVPAGTVHFDSCHFDTTGVHSMTREGLDRCSPIILNFSAASSTLQDVDITLDLSSMLDNNSRFSQCFSACTALTSVRISGISDYKVISCYAMFRDCSSLTSVTMNSFVAGYEGGSMSSYDWMFGGCHNLVTVDSIDLSRWSNVNNMFWDCPNLVNLTITNIKDASLTTWGLDNCISLSVNSLVGIFNALPQSSRNSEIRIGTTNINKLSAAQLAIATNKGWRVS